MKIKQVNIIILGLLLVSQGTLLKAADEKSYHLSEAVQKIIETEKKQTTDSSKVTFPEVKFYLETKEIELSTPIMMIDGKTFLPVRALGKVLGIDVNYAPQHKVAYIDTPNVELELPLYYNKAVKNKTTVLEIEGAKVELYKGSTYLPIRFVGENLGYKVDYKDNKIIFTKKK